MTTPTFNRTRALELLNLDAKRTQGYWEVHRPRKKVYIRNSDGIYILEQTQAGIRTKNDAAFIAAAPELAEQLRLAVSELEMHAGPCNWTEDDGGNWDTSCAHRFVFGDGAPADNEFSHCPYCGGKLQQCSYQEPTE